MKALKVINMSLDSKSKIFFLEKEILKNIFEGLELIIKKTGCEFKKEIKR